MEFANAVREFEGMSKAEANEVMDEFLQCWDEFEYAMANKDVEMEESVDDAEKKTKPHTTTKPKTNTTANKTNTQMAAARRPGESDVPLQSTDGSARSICASS